MPTVQEQNAELVALMSAYFWGRNESNVAWRHAVSSILALPALRAFWPMSSVDYTVASRTRDIAGGGYHLSDNNTPVFGYDQLAPHVEFDGVNQYLSRADGGAANWADITGIEAYVAAAQRGLTLGGWFYFDVLGTTATLLSKWGAGGQQSYLLQRQAANTARFAVHSGAVFASSGVIPVVTSTWYFMVGRFIPSTEVNIFVNDNASPVVAGIPAALADSTIGFSVGARAVPSDYLDGRASLCFLCAAALSDSIISALFHQTRKLYNV